MYEKMGMLMDRDIAVQISKIMLEMGSKLDDTVLLIKNNCSEAEFIIYRNRIGIVMGHILLEVLNPLYLEHPDITPKELL